ncbi:MAG: J domain-containing protein [Alphaproteobacteria bacterium]|nr:J domain-containing protein [Alphaproteobacteria bacterium]
MADDPYEVLGLPRAASQEDVRKAYRKLAKQLHPDLHPGDRKAEERFKRVSQAYDILGNADKRARYDRGEIDAAGAERPKHDFYRRYADAGPGKRYDSHAGYADIEGLGDIFTDLFGEARPGGSRFRMRGGEARYELAVEFLDAVNGAKRRITTPDGKVLDLQIPPGVHEGQTLRLQGQGHPGLGGGPPGDALVGIRITPHPVFERRGDDIHSEVAISLPEAVLGGRITVETVNGPVSVTVPKGANSGTTLRLRGKGALSGRAKTRGDHYARLKVVLPPAGDDELESFARDWGRRRPYDPRRTGGG